MNQPLHKEGIESMTENTPPAPSGAPPPTADQHTGITGAAAPPCDALSRLQAILARDHDYRPITDERAAELAGALVGQDEDEQAFTLIELLRGIAAAHFGELRSKDTGTDRPPGVEDVVHAASVRAYERTVHCSYSFDEFAALDPQHPRDRRVLHNEIIEAGAEQSPSGATGTDRQAAADELAGHIAAVLNHPDTPVSIYNALGDAVCSLDTPRRCFDSAEYIALCLRMKTKQPAGDGAAQQANEFAARAHAFASQAYSSALKAFYQSDGAVEPPDGPE